MLLAIVVFFTLIEAVFTALEVAMGSASRSRLRALAENERVASERLTSERLTSERLASERLASEQKNRIGEPAPVMASRALRVLELLEKPRRLNFLFVGITSLSLWTASCALVIHARHVGWNKAEVALSLLAVLFVAEVLPLLWASRRPENVALRGVGLASATLRVLDPLLRVLQNIGGVGARALGDEKATGVTTDELRSALATAEEEGVIESDERALLEGAMDFRERAVREVMTPRRDVTSVEPHTALREVLQVALREGHSRLPVFEGADAVGIVAAKDILPDLRRSNSVATARDIMRAPLFVQADEAVAVVLENLRRERSLMAIVRDDSQAPGGIVTLGIVTVGIVTLEDLLEEIVGPIQDEYDIDEKDPLRLIEIDVPTSNNRTSNNRTSSTRCVAVEAGADVKVREFERFWRESVGESVRLQNREGEAPPSSQNLIEFAQIFGVGANESFVVGKVWHWEKHDDSHEISAQNVAKNEAQPTLEAKSEVGSASGAKSDVGEIRSEVNSEARVETWTKPLLMRLGVDAEGKAVAHLWSGEN